MKENQMNSLDKMEHAMLIEEYQLVSHSHPKDMDSSEAIFECLQKVATHANSKHSAILEDYDRLAKLCKKQAEEIAQNRIVIKRLSDEYAKVCEENGGLQEQLSAANAIIAMQAEALKECDAKHPDYSECCSLLVKAITASAESVTAWECEKLKPLQKQVAMQRNELSRALIWLHSAYDRPPQTPSCIDMLQKVASAFSYTQAAADAFMAEEKAKALEDAADKFMPSIAAELRILAAELRGRANPA